MLITRFRLSGYDFGPILEHRLADCKQTWTHDGFRYRAFCFTCSNHSWIHTGTRFQNFDVVFSWWNNMGSNPCSIMTELLVRHSTVSIMGYIARAEHGKHGSGTGPARSVLATWGPFFKTPLNWPPEAKRSSFGAADVHFWYCGVWSHTFRPNSTFITFTYLDPPYIPY